MSWGHGQERTALPPPQNLRRADAYEPWPGARALRVPRTVQWMADSPKSILVWDFAGACHYWVPRRLWTGQDAPEMAGDAGPVWLPQYFVERLGLSGGP